MPNQPPTQKPVFTLSLQPPYMSTSRGTRPTTGRSEQSGPDVQSQSSPPSILVDVSKISAPTIRRMCRAAMQVLDYPLGEWHMQQ